MSNYDKTKDNKTEVSLYLRYLKDILNEIKSKIYHFSFTGTKKLFVYYYLFTT